MQPQPALAEQQGRVAVGDDPPAVPAIGDALERRGAAEGVVVAEDLVADDDAAPGGADAQAQRLVGRRPADESLSSEEEDDLSRAVSGRVPDGGDRSDGRAVRGGDD